MQFTLITVLSLVAVAFAGPIAMPQRLDDIIARSPVDAEAAAMSTKNGEVVDFNSAAVYLAAVDAGQ